MKKLIFSALLLLSVSVAAQNISTDDSAATHYPDHYKDIHIKAWLDTTSILVGDQLWMHISIENIIGTGEACRFNVGEMPSGSVEFLESTCDTIGKNIEFKVLTTSFEAGHHILPQIMMGIVTDGSTVIVLSPADSLVLDVAYIAEADTVKCETKGDIANFKEPITFKEIVHWVAYLLLAAILAFAALLLITQRKGHQLLSILPKAAPIPADRRALNELENLRRKELWQKGRVKKYYTDMTDIVRRFLHNMYGITATEMTTKQTLRAFHAISDWSEDSESLLRQLLQKADMVKFAKSQPETYEHDQAMQFAADFVRRVAEQHKINNPESEEKK